MITPIIFLFCFASFLSFLKLERKTAKVFFLLFGGLLFLLAAFRDGNISRDYDAYVEMFYTIRSLNFIDVEPSFIFIAKIVTLLFDSPLILFVIYALLGVSLKCIAIKELSQLWFLSLLIYISNLYILHELTQIRIGVATGFFLLCIKPIYERNLKHFTLFATLAILFHYSAIIILPLWFLRGKTFNKKIWLGILVGVYLLHFFGIKFSSLLNLIPFDFISSRVSIYQALTRDNNLPGLNVFSALRLIYLLVATLLIWKISIIREKNDYAILLLKIFIISIVSFVVFSDIPVFAFRISELLGIVEIILIPLLFYIFTPKIGGNIFVVSIAFAIFYLTVFYAKIIL